MQPGKDGKFFVVAVCFATILRSRPVRALLFPLTLANTAKAGAAGRWLTGRGTPKIRPLLRVGFGHGKVNAV